MTPNVYLLLCVQSILRVVPCDDLPTPLSFYEIVFFYASPSRSPPRASAKKVENSFKKHLTNQDYCAAAFDDEGVKSGPCN